MASVFHDVRIAVRTLLRRPVTSVVIVLTLGVGLAASTTVFTVFDLLVLGPLPFGEPEELVRLRQTLELPGQGVRESSVAGRNFVAWRESSSSFDDMAAARFRTLTLGGEGDPERVVGIEATWNHFDVLGVDPVVGRTFRPDEDRPDAASPVAVLSHSIWTRRFGRDPSIVGRDIVIGERPHTVVGVMPEGFRYPYSAEIWTPLGLGSGSEEWDVGFLNVSARLADGVTVEEAREELAAVHARIRAQRPGDGREVGTALIRIRDEVLEGVDEKVRALLLAAVFVLLIATVNVASMVLARSHRREGEVSVRLALGAGRLDLVRPVLAEALVLGLAGGALGLAAAGWLGPTLAAMSPVDDVGPYFQEIGLNARVLLFVVVASAVAAALVTVPAALRAVNQRPRAGLARSRGGTTGGRRVLDGLITMEVAVAVVLLTGAGLMVESIRNLRATDLGVDPEGLVTFGISPSTAGYSAAGERMAFVDGVVERVRALPAVDAAAVTNFNPLKDQGWGNGVWPADRPPTPEQSNVTINHRAVTPGFLETAGIDLLAGRGIEESDGADDPAVAVVSRSLAERLWPGEEAIGRTLIDGNGGDPEAPRVTVVGVAEDVADFGDVSSTWYRPLRQDPSEFPTGTLEIFVRSGAATAGLPEPLVRQVRAAVADADPALPVFQIQTLDEIVSFERRVETFTTLLLSIFAGAGLLLAAVGIYGVLSYVVGRRRREIGIRVALGARPGQVRALVLRGALTVTALGLVIGLAAAGFLTRFLEGFLVGVDPLEPGIYAAMAFGCLVVATGAAWLPARRAMSVHPRETLVEE